MSGGAYKAMCPSCGCFGSPEIFLAEPTKYRAIARALNMPPPLAELLQRYIALFRPPKRANTMDRVERLLAELLEPIETGRVQRKGRSWPAPVAVWQAALEEVIQQADRLSLPLKSHGYLLEVVAGLSDKLEAQAEREREQAAAAATPRRGNEARPETNAYELWKRDMLRLGRQDLVEQAERARGNRTQEDATDA